MALNPSDHEVQPHEPKPSSLSSDVDNPPKAAGRGGAAVDLLLLTLPVLASAVTSLASVPVIIHTLGPTQWSGYALGQSVGSMLAVIAAWGWGAVGPTTIAALPDDRRADYLMGSLPPRLAIWSICAIPGVVVAGILSPANTSLGTNIAGMLLLSTVGWGCGWYYIGIGAPRHLLARDALPRLVIACASLAALAVTKSIYVYALLQASAEVLCIILVLRYVRSTSSGRVNINGTLLDRIRSNVHGLTVTVAAASYVQIPLMVAAGVGIPNLTVYALGDKLFAAAKTATGPIVSLAQSRVPRDRANGIQDGLEERVRTAVRLVILTAPLLVVGFAVFAPFVGSLLSNGQIHVPPTIALPLGLALALMIISGVTGIAALVALDKTRVVATSVIVGAAVGLPVLVVLSRHLGGAGTAWGVCLAEAVTACWQLVALHQTLHAREGQIR